MVDALNIEPLDCNRTFSCPSIYFLSNMRALFCLSNVHKYLCNDGSSVTLIVYMLYSTDSSSAIYKGYVIFSMVPNVVESN